MTSHIRPHICYCQIPWDRLEQIARRRFVDGIPTNQLMGQFTDPHDKEYLAAIAILDVPAGELKAVVPDDPDLLMHLQDCRGHVKDALKKAGVLIRDRRASAGLGPEWTGRNE